MNRLRYLFLLCGLVWMNVHGQFAYFQSQPELQHEPEISYESLVFELNGQIIAAADSSVHPLAVLDGLNTCKAMLPQDTLVFLANFKYGQTYFLKPGCCCAIFTLEAKYQPSRGTVSVKNTTSETLILTVCEHNADTLAPGEESTLYASESAMCLFKPCHIILASPAYFDPKFEADVNGQLSGALKAERSKYLYSELNFQFLQAENLWLEPRERKHDALLKLKKPWTAADLEEMVERGY